MIARGDQVQLSGLSHAVTERLPGAGTLDPLTDELGARKVISIASNSGFSLRSNDGAEQFSVRVLSAGENAQAQGFSERTDPRVIYQQTSKTAIRPGAPESQSIELEISWSGAGTPDLFLIAE